MTNTEPVHALNLDLSQQESFVRYFRGMPNKPATTVRFFNRSDYYTVHGDDATLISQIVVGANIVKYMGAEPKLSYMVVSRKIFEKAVRELLLIKQYRVEVYTKSAQSRSNDWILEFKGSPGNVSQFENILFDVDVVINSSVMAVKLLRNRVLAVGIVNTTESQFYAAEFNDNDSFTELEGLLAQVSPKECIVASGETAEQKMLTSIIDRSGIFLVNCKKTEFTSENIIQDLDRLLYFDDEQQRNASTLPQTNLTEAMGCLHVAIDYLKLTLDDQNFNQFKLSSLDTHLYVHIDNAVLYALNIFPKDITTITGTNKFNSVMGMLNYCCTPQGRRLLEQWIKNPLKDLNLIVERLDIVETLMKDSDSRHTLHTYSLTKLPDLLLLAKKLSGKKVTLQDCYRIYQAVGSIPNLVSVLQKPGNKHIKAALIDPICELLGDMENYQAMIESTINLELVDRGEFLVTASFDKDLEALHEQKQEIEERMQRLLRNVAEDLGFEAGKNVKLNCTEQHGYFFRVTLKEEVCLRQNKNYQIIDAIKGGVRFTNSKLTNLNESYTEVKKNYEKEQKTATKQIFETAASYANTLRTLNTYIAKVDVLVSLATAAAKAPIPFVKPKMYEMSSGVLRLKGVRHPCLELQDGISFIPNDAEFKKDEKVLHVITGPNMGGKSTYIKSVGICVLLAHIGSLVPCTEAEISIVDCIMARVGADDSQLKGLSTFMLEMVETASIIKTATSNSLVVIDELGRGTSTYDGFGMAWSIAQYLVEKVNCFTMFATHFHQITDLAEIIPTVYNLHVTAVTTEKTITPLYQVRQGACDKSYGIHCARLAGFPPDVIEFAIEQQKQLESEQGMKYIQDYEASLKRKVIKEGDELLEKTIEDCKKLKGLSGEDLMDALRKLKSDLESHDNLFVKGLLSESNL